MSFTIIITMIATVAFLATFAASASVAPSPSSENSNVETFDSASVESLPQQLPINFQLPNEQQPALAFYPTQPVNYLRAPVYVPTAPEASLYQLPEPSEFLTVPAEGTGDICADNPYLCYYNSPSSVPSILTNLDDGVVVRPTNQFPKKFNKNVHLKNKPYSHTPKKEVELKVITPEQLQIENEELFKHIDKFDKLRNQKEIKQEQARQTLQI